MIPAPSVLNIRTVMISVFNKIRNNKLYNLTYFMNFACFSKIDSVWYKVKIKGGRHSNPCGEPATFSGETRAYFS